MKLSIVIVFVAIFTLSCEENKETGDVTAHSSDTESVEEPAATEEVDESAIALIDSYRQRLETEIEEPIEIKSEELREKTKQKWEKIHFYLQDGNVVRIKSYPHEGISERTEEFYLKDGQLVLAVIEDHGLMERGKEQKEFDKMYYFDSGEVIKEIVNEKESEFGIKNSDGEELLSEVKEYLNLYKEKSGKNE